MPGAQPSEIAFYEGLIRKTAAIYSPRIQEDYEDIVQILRVKVWKALLAYDPERSTQQVEKFVFSCVANQVKDLLKRKRRNELYIEEIRGTELETQTDVFDGRYLAVTSEQALAEAELERPLIPSTLTDVERRVLALLYADYSQRESATRLGLTRAEVERAVRGIRQKMADWQPSTTPQPVATPVAA